MKELLTEGFDEDGIDAIMSEQVHLRMVISDLVEARDRYLSSKAEHKYLISIGDDTGSIALHRVEKGYAAQATRPDLLGLSLFTQEAAGKIAEEVADGFPDFPVKVVTVTDSLEKRIELVREIIKELNTWMEFNKPGLLH